MSKRRSKSWYSKLPDESLSVYEPYKKLFFETMFERQMIWKRRFLLNQSRPWTDNEILNNFKFTNVYRELDRNSQWLIKNIITDSSLSVKNLVWKMMVFRFFNNPETFTFDVRGKAIQTSLFDEENGIKRQVNSVKDLISARRWKNGIPDYDEYDEDEFSRFIEGIRSVGQNPYTTAYLVHSGFHSRDYYHTRVVIPTLHKNIDKIVNVILNFEKVDDIIKFLETLPNVSDFMSHEFYQDFTYIPRYTNRKFIRFDQNDYTNVGPGASVGIRLIYPNLKGKEQKEGIYRLRDEAETMLSLVAKEKNVDSFPYLYWNKSKHFYETKNECNITLHQIEMWLCEFQKYFKMMIGEGKQRSKFIPKTL
jgi:hypothetical protein